MIVLFTLLVLIAIITNGMTEASGAVTGAITARKLSPSHAVTLAAIGNFLGAILMIPIRSGIAFAFYGIADFGGVGEYSLKALCAALAASTLWIGGASRAGIPISQTHSLISAMCGAAFATNMSSAPINVELLKPIFIGMAFSTLIAFFVAFFIYSVFIKFCESNGRKTVTDNFFRSQILSTITASLVHGAQNSQKFIGVYILGLSMLWPDKVNIRDDISIAITLIFAMLLSFGTLMGRVNIVKKVALDMLHLDSAGESIAKAASSLSLFLASLFSIPASTTLARICARIGIGRCKGSRMNLGIIFQILSSWLITFPACAFLGFFLSLILT